MRFEVEQHFPAPVDAVLALYVSDSFYEALQGLPKIGEPTVLARERDGGLVTMHVRYRFTGDLPAAALAVIDPGRLTWVDVTTYDTADRRSDTRLVPDHYRDRLEATATASYEDTLGGSRRNIVGELRVRMPLVGGKVEQAIVSGLREHLADEQAVAARLLTD